MLNPKLETLNSKQTQMAKYKSQNQLLRNQKYFFQFYILDLFRV